MRRVSGYMTVEASFIVPMVIGVFVIIIYLANFMYARCILSQDAYILAFRATLNKENPQQYISQKSDQLTGKRYFGNKKPEFSCKKEGKQIIVTGTTTTKHAAMGNYFLKPGSGFDIKAVARAKVMDYPGHIRTVKRIMDIGLNKEN